MNETPASIEELEREVILALAELALSTPEAD